VEEFGLNSAIQVLYVKMMIALIENEKKDTEGVKMYKNLE